MNQSGYTSPADEHPFAPYVRILGKGKSGSRSLSLEEAEAAFTMILQERVEPLQLGAFLMLLRVKEETPDELAGFVRACRAAMQAPPPALRADLDWSSYAGKKHQHPWYILTMLLLSGAGYRVFVHGCEGHTPGRLYTEDAMRQLGLPVAAHWHEVEGQLASDRLSYLPLRNFCLPLHGIMQLRPLLGLRSPVNTLTRMLNPIQAPCSIQSIFHPAYATLHQATDRIMDQPRAVVFKGDSGEVEIKPQADTTLHLLTDGREQTLSLHRSREQRPAAVAQAAVKPLQDLWRGVARDDYGLEATLATTAVALLLLQPGTSAEAARENALTLWHERDTRKLS
jgi:anthranilate phosphoribosyltransferase